MAKKLPKRLIFCKACNMDEKDKYSPSEFRQFYYSEDVETSNVETATGISKSQDTIDNYIKKQERVNPNKKTVTHTLFSTSWKLTL